MKRGKLFIHFMAVALERYEKRKMEEQKNESITKRV